MLNTQMINDHESNSEHPTLQVGHFMVAIGAFIMNKEENEILLVKRSGHAGINEGLWEIIYGRIDQHEELEEGLKREVWEETGIQDIEISKLLHVWHIYRGEKKAENEVYGFTFACQTNQKEVTLSSEHTEYRWVSFEEAMKMDNLLPGLKDTLGHIKNRKGNVRMSDIHRNSKLL